MRSTYVVSYDVSDPRRLRLVFKTMRGYGDWIQLSVFRCELSPRELVELKARLRDVLHLGEDQVLFADLGPTEGRGSESITSLGRVYSPPERCAIVV